MTLLRGLNASGVASLFRKSFSSLERVRGSLLERKLNVELSPGLLAATKRSGEVVELARIKHGAESKVVNDGLLRYEGSLDRAVTRGRVAGVCGRSSSQAPSYLLVTQVGVGAFALCLITLLAPVKAC